MANNYNIEKLGIIYKATDPTGKLYIGQTIQNLNERKRGRYNPYFQNAINKYGDKMKWEIVGMYPIDRLDFVECCCIYYMNTIYPNGYNFESGGSKNKIVSEETKRKLSIANSGKRSSLSEEHKRKLSEARKGKRYAAKLTWTEVKEIREAYKTGKYFQRVLGEKYGVDQTQISNIINNKNWVINKFKGKKL